MVEYLRDSLGVHEMQVAIEGNGPTASPAAFEYFMCPISEKCINAIGGEGAHSDNPQGGNVAGHPSRATKKRLAAQGLHEPHGMPGPCPHENAGFPHDYAQEPSHVYSREEPHVIGRFFTTKKCWFPA